MTTTTTIDDDALRKLARDKSAASSRALGAIAGSTRADYSHRYEAVLALGRRRADAAALAALVEALRALPARWSSDDDALAYCAVEEIARHKPAVDAVDALVHVASLSPGCEGVVVDRLHRRVTVDRDVRARRDVARVFVVALRGKNRRDSETRWAAVSGLALCGGRDAVAPLALALDDARLPIRDAALRGLARIGGPAAVTVLTTRHGRSRGETKRRLAAALGKARRSPR